MLCVTLLGCASESTLGTDEIPVTFPTLIASETPVLPVPTPTPTLSHTPTPLPDIQATIRAGVRATIDNIPTPTFTPTSTFTPTPTPPPPTPTDTATHISLPTATPSVAPSPPTSESIAERIEEVRSGVVRVGTNFGTGSGFIFDVDDEGKAFLLTNYHLVEYATSLTVLVDDFTVYTARILGYDLSRDLVVLEMCCDNAFKALTFSDASIVEPQTSVISMGYIPGRSGVAKATQARVIGVRHQPDSDRWIIQTDLPIDFNASGGALLNTDGEVIGISTPLVRHHQAGTMPVNALSVAISEVTLRGLLPMLKDGVVISPSSSAAYGQTSYSSSRFWYTIDVPEGWGLDASLDELIGMWDPESSAAVWVHVQEIDPESFPNLDDYIAVSQPPANDKITNLTVLGQNRVGSNGPMESQEFSLRFTYRNVTYQAFLRWHLLGRHLASVWAMTEESVLELEQFADVRQLFNLTTGSFKPWVKYNHNFQYALSHPLEWQDGAVSGLDYWAFDPDSSRQISVRVEQFVGTRDINEYGSNITTFDAKIDSRGIVFPERVRPSYRIDYTTINQTTGSSHRGSILITLYGSDAVSVVVVGDAEEWAATKAMADEIFLRFRVNR